MHMCRTTKELGTSELDSTVTESPEVDVAGAGSQSASSTGSLSGRARAALPPCGRGVHAVVTKPCMFEELKAFRRASDLFPGQVSTVPAFGVAMCS